MSFLLVSNLNLWPICLLNDPVTIVPQNIFVFQVSTLFLQVQLIWIPILSKYQIKGPSKFTCKALSDKSVKKNAVI